MCVTHNDDCLCDNLHGKEKRDPRSTTWLRLSVSNSPPRRLGAAIAAALSPKEKAALWLDFEGVLRQA